MKEETKSGAVYENLNVQKLSGSEIEITGEIPETVAESYRGKTMQSIIQNLELPGFRKGHVPEAVAVKHVGEPALLKEIAESALGDVYARIVEDKALQVVGRPAVTITKLAPGNPIGFKIRSAVYPEIQLPDYKSIAKSERKKFTEDKLEISDEEVSKELTHIQRMVVSAKTQDEKTAALPEPDDAFAKSLGEFKDLRDLKEKIKEQLLREKKLKKKEKQRLTLAEAVIAKSALDIPSVFIEGELDQMVASFTDRVKRAGLELDAYLKQVGKAIEDLRKEWRTDAEKRAKLQLVFNEIANTEGLRPDPERLAREVEHVREHYPDADEVSVRVYVASQMTNEMVFELLEGTKPGEGAKQHDHGHEHDESYEHKD